MAKVQYANLQKYLPVTSFKGSRGSLLEDSREAQGIKDAHACLLRPPSIALPRQPVREYREDLGEAERYLILALLRRKGIENPNSRDSLHSHAALQGMALYRPDLPTRSLPAAGTLGRKILKQEHVWLVAAQEFIHLANDTAAPPRTLRSPIQEKRRSFENSKGKTP